MKRGSVLAVLLCIAAVMSGGYAHAWIEKGSQEIGLSGFIDDYTQEPANCPTCSKTEVTNMNLSLTYGYFLSRNFEIGVSVTEQQNNSTSIPPTGAKTVNESETLTLAPLVRFLFNVKENAVVVPYIGAEYGIVNGDSKNTSSTGFVSSSDVSGTSLGLSLGIKYFPVDMASINFDVKFRKYTFDSKSTASTTTYEFERTGPYFTIGASIFF